MKRLSKEAAQNKIESLPKWAQDYITDIRRERQNAVQALNDYCDNQTPSPFYVEELESTGEQQGPSLKRRYIQAHNVMLNYCGVLLRISAWDDEVKLQWSTPDRSTREVAMVPHSHQMVRIIAKENMR